MADQLAVKVSDVVDRAKTALQAQQKLRDTMAIVAAEVRNTLAPMPPGAVQK